MSAFNSQVRREIAEVLNRHGIDNFLNTPDFVLTDLMVEAAETYGRAHARCGQFSGAAVDLAKKTDRELAEDHPENTSLGRATGLR